MKLVTSKESGSNWLLVYGLFAAVAALCVMLAPEAVSGIFKNLKMTRVDLVNGLVMMGLALAARKFDSGLWLYIGVAALVMDGAAVSFLFQVRTMQTFGPAQMLPLLKLVVAFMVLRGALAMANPFHYVSGGGGGGKQKPITPLGRDESHVTSWGTDVPELGKSQGPNIYGSHSAVSASDYQKPESRECPACGAQMPPAKRFCTSCGNKLE